MEFIKKIVLVIFISCLSFQSFSQTEDEDIQYVTGKLRLSLYKEAESGSKVLRLLVSGDKLDVREIAGPYAKVKTDTGKIGWVKRGFLVKEKPAVILHKEIKEAFDQLKQQVEETSGKDEDKLKIVELENQIIELEEKLTVTAIQEVVVDSVIDVVEDKEDIETTEVQELDLKNDSNSSISLVEPEIVLTFLKEYVFFIAGFFILLILIGFRMGEIKTEHQVIKHFGGVRVWK